MNGHCRLADKCRCVSEVNLCPSWQDAPVRIQRKRTKGWKMPEGAVYVGRPTRWGNPFNFSSSDNCWNALALGCRGDAKGRREASVKAYRQWVANPGGRIKEIEFGVVVEGRNKKTGRLAKVPIGPRAMAGESPAITEIQAALRGKDLACFCPLDQPCHADVLLELANAPGHSPQNNEQPVSEEEKT